MAEKKIKMNCEYCGTPVKIVANTKIIRALEAPFPPHYEPLSDSEMKNKLDIAVAALESIAKDLNRSGVPCQSATNARQAILKIKGTFE